MRGLTQRAPFVCALIVLAVSASAQSNDAQYGSWSWSTNLLGPTGNGVGGSAVALKDDASIMALNPAVLTTLSRTEFLASAYQQPATTVLRGDEVLSRSEISMLGGATLLSPRLAVGGFLLRPRSVETTFSSAALPDGSHTGGSLRSAVTDVGAAFAWHPTKRVHVGVEVVASHLELQGTAGRFSVLDAEDSRVASAAGQTKVVYNLGLLLELTPTLTAGGSIVNGTTWSTDRNALSPANRDAVLDAGSQYRVRRPREIIGGGAWQATQRLRFSAEVDYIAYSELQSSLSLTDRTIPGGYEANDALEPRLGAEISLPIGNGATAQLRGGIHFRGANALRYVGTDPVGPAIFPGATSATEGSVGASVLLKTVALHLSYSAGSDGDAAHLSAGLALRF